MPYQPKDPQRPVPHDPEVDPGYIDRCQKEYLRQFFGNDGLDTLEVRAAIRFIENWKYRPKAGR
ncbi:MAG: hypothetical protein KKD18_02810 [Nanoarchaeota archaeon]|nr:hypothetical protein [Nanoarchaeota archaeon]